MKMVNTSKAEEFSNQPQASALAALFFESLLSDGGLGQAQDQEYGETEQRRQQPDAEPTEPSRDAERG